MTFRFDFIYLVAALLFFYSGYRQFYLRTHVDELERAGKLPPDAAIRIRKKPMRLIGSLGFVAGAGFLFLAFVAL